MQQWSIALERCLAFRDDPGRDARFFDIGFSQFQADPVTEVAKLYRWLGDDLTEESVEKMLAWRAENPKDQHGPHDYDGADFGISEESLKRQFGAYHKRFARYLG